MDDLLTYAAEAPARRIDVTIQRLQTVIANLPPDRHAALARQSFWPLLDTAVAIRAMERGDGGCDLADAYDRVVTPGGDPVRAVLAALREVYGGRTNA